VPVTLEPDQVPRYPGVALEDHIIAHVLVVGDGA
jgi:hypothetical protein